MKNHPVLKPRAAKWTDDQSVVSIALGRKHETDRCLTCGLLVPESQQTQAWWQFWWNNGPYHATCPPNPMVRPSSSNKSRGKK